MKDEMKGTLINGEKKQGIQFTLSFKWVLAVSIGLTGILSIGGILFFILGILNQTWKVTGINNFLYQALFYLCVLLCFVALVSIAVIKEPFSKVLVWCTMAIGFLFIISSIIFPHITGYKCNGLSILSSEKFTLFDGTLLMIGMLGILFSKVLQYGFMYQINSDMTIYINHTK